jgi:hypothetical protein
MRFYNRQHRHYCGIDLHVKTMYICILDTTGQVLLHKNFKSTPQHFLEAVGPFRDDLVVAAECMFTWYWLADVWPPSGFPSCSATPWRSKRFTAAKQKTTNSTPTRLQACFAGD